MRQVAAAWRLLLLALALAVAACGSSVELVGGLQENEANEVLGALLTAGVQARKVIGKDVVKVEVDQEQLARAIEVLREVGLPHPRRSKMGEVFRKENLISSPLEERARYVYALSQELEQTLSSIDGVVTPRVHVVLPERMNPGEPVVPSSASVFLKHRAGYGVENIASQVRLLVANSIPGLVPEKVTVVLIPAVLTSQNVPIPLDAVWFFKVEAGSAPGLRALLLAMSAVLLGGLGMAAYLSLRGKPMTDAMAWFARLKRRRE